MSTSFAFGTKGGSAPGYHPALIPPIPARELSFRDPGDSVSHVERVVSFFDDQRPEVCDVPVVADDWAKTPGLFRRELNA